MVPSYIFSVPERTANLFSDLVHTVYPSNDWFGVFMPKLDDVETKHVVIHCPILLVVVAWEPCSMAGCWSHNRQHPRSRKSY